MKKAAKKAFLMVGLGIAYQEARQLLTDSVGDKLRSDFPNYEVRRAFASRTLIEKLAECDGIQVDNEIQALERLKEEGFTEIIVQPFQIAAGEEYERIRDIVQYYTERNGFSRIETLPCVTVWAKPINSITH
ncbi:Sirohydrochlorin cobaltochelatase [Sporomusa rhizae]|uniref:sirohydrochlorin cobaltochelatase n=1 Tax=Sporomusa rhizae TaxID=357999 RepID=UPI00352A972C